MDWKIEVVTVPVSDVDRAIDFYVEKMGFEVDIDFRVSDEVRTNKTGALVAGTECGSNSGSNRSDTRRHLANRETVKFAQKLQICSTF